MKINKCVQFKYQIDNLEDHTQLLRLENEEDCHYVQIKEFNKLMYNKTKHKEKNHFCIDSLQWFIIEKVLTKH